MGASVVKKFISWIFMAMFCFPFLERYTFIQFHYTIYTHRLRNERYDKLIISSFFLVQKLFRFGHWNGYKCNTDPKVKNKKPWFQVKNCSDLLKRYNEYHVTVGCDNTESTSGSCYKIRGMAGKSDFKILDRDERVVAEVSFLDLCRLI